MKELVERIKFERIFNKFTSKLTLLDENIYDDDEILYMLYKNKEYVIYHEDISKKIGFGYEIVHYRLIDYIYNNYGIDIRKYAVSLIDNVYEISLEEYEEIIRKD